MNFKKDEIMFLLGAGASKDAGIPTSWDMIKQIEELLEGPWKDFRPLYNYIKSAIYYAEGIGGKFDSTITYNIERLVNTLSELEQKEEHTIYPFIGNWNIKLVEVAESDFSHISKFKKEIIEQLRGKWILRQDYKHADYVKKFLDFSQIYTFPLRLFTLNYDLCIERNIASEHIERGFEDNQERTWNWRLFEESENPNPDILIYLYKLHGSIDWLRDTTTGNLTYSDEPSNIDLDKLHIIFGTNYKLQYIDPFLFFAYEFRKYTLESKLIVTIGYGFGDEHINGMIGQALKSDPHKKILCVILGGKEKKEEIKIALQLDSTEQIILKDRKAKDFLNNDFNIKQFETMFDKDEDDTPF